MLRFERLDDRKILIITTDGPLEESDFKEFAKQVGADSQAENRPTRLMVRTESFPGWERRMQQRSCCECLLHSTLVLRPPSCVDHRDSSPGFDLPCRHHAYGKSRGVRDEQ